MEGPSTTVLVQEKEHLARMVDIPGLGTGDVVSIHVKLPGVCQPL